MDKQTLISIWFLLCLCASCSAKGIVEGVRLGDLVKIESPYSRSLLSSSSRPFIHSHSSRQQCVLGVDSNRQPTPLQSVWKVVPVSRHRIESVRQVLQEGERFRLLHPQTKRFLHAHADFKSPLKSGFEVTAFGELGKESDSNDEWILRHGGGTTKAVDGVTLPIYQLQHVMTKGNLCMKRPERHAENAVQGLNLTSATSEVFVELDGLNAACLVQVVPVPDSTIADMLHQEIGSHFLESGDLWLPPKNINLGRRFLSSTSDALHTPKEINIQCEGDALVMFDDLPSYNDENICLKVSLGGANFVGSLTVDCEGEAILHSGYN